MHNLDDLLHGTQTLQNFLTKRLLPHRIGELLNNFEVDVRFEKRDAYFLERLLNVLFGEAALPAQVLENALQFFGKCFEHDFKYTRFARK